MKIEKYINDEGEYRCFAVDNHKVSRNGLVKMIAQVEGVMVTKPPKFYDDDVFCEFELNGKTFIIEEPYGDNSTYDVVASEPDLAEMDLLFQHIQETAPLKGGDIGRRFFFFSMKIVGSAILFSIIYALWVGHS